MTTGSLPVNSARGAIYQHVVRRLRSAGSATAEIDTRVLMSAAAHVDEVALIADPDVVMPEEALELLEQFVARRLAGEPVSRILGEREFWGLSFALNADTLDPRPDSEALVEAVLQHVQKKAAPLTLLDLGTGTGCLLLALLSELPNARGHGVDCAPEAVSAARQNAESLGLAERATFTAGSWGEGLEGPFDIVVSNPPYIPAADIETLSPEVRVHDPMLALDGGADGLVAYRAVADETKRLLALGGAGFWELGIGQGDDVSQIAHLAGLEVVGLDKDLGGVHRVLKVKRSI